MPNQNELPKAIDCAVKDQPVEEYPKMLYKHPEDETKEHTFITVNSEDEELQALDKGYQCEPHVPVVKDGNGVVKENPTDNPNVIPQEQKSPGDVLDEQHLNKDDNGEKIAEEK